MDPSFREFCLCFLTADWDISFTCVTCEIMSMLLLLILHCTYIQQQKKEKDTKLHLTFIYCIISKVKHLGSRLQHGYKTWFLVLVLLLVCISVTNMNEIKNNKTEKKVMCPYICKASRQPKEKVIPLFVMI